MWTLLTHPPAETRSIVKGSAGKERPGVMRHVPLHLDTAHSALEGLEEEEEDMEEVEIFVEEITVEEDLAEVEDLGEALDVAEVTVEEVEDLEEDLVVVEVTVEEVGDLEGVEDLEEALDVAEVTAEEEDSVVEASPTVEEIRAMLDLTQDITLDVRVVPVHLLVDPRGEDSMDTMEGLLVGLGLVVILWPVSCRRGRRTREEARCLSHNLRVSQSHNLRVSPVVLDGNGIKHICLY